jgi:hypothetical protein
LGRLGRADAGQAGEFPGCGCGKAGEVAVEAGKQVAREIDGTFAAYADAQKDRQQFGIRKRCRAVPDQPLARPFRLRANRVWPWFRIPAWLPIGGILMS